MRKSSQRLVLVIHQGQIQHQIFRHDPIQQRFYVVIILFDLQHHTYGKSKGAANHGYGKTIFSAQRCHQFLQTPQGKWPLLSCFGKDAKASIRYRRAFLNRECKHFLPAFRSGRGERGDKELIRSCPDSPNGRRDLGLFSFRQFLHFFQSRHEVRQIIKQFHWTPLPEQGFPSQ
nr:MAG TPA: hypothetical protein [Caudoviricetes sp.]